MIKHLLTGIISLFSLLMPGYAQAQTLSLREAFSTINAPELSLLTPSTRLDMMDFAAEHKPYEAVNEMFGTSSITHYSDSCIDVQISQVSSAQMVMLPVKKGELFALIYTLDADGADSQISFYNGSLKKLKTTKYLKEPTLSDFLAPQYSKDREALTALQELIPFTLVSYSWDPSAHCLWATLSVKDIISKEAYTEAGKYLVAATPQGTHSIAYSWDGSKFACQQKK